MVNMFRIRTNYAGVVVGPAVTTSFWTAAAFDATNAQAAVNKIAAFYTAIKSSFAGGQTWTHSGAVDVIDSDTGDLVNFFNVTSASDGGSASGEPLPPAVQVNMRLDTGIVFNRKRVRGHWYIPGCAEASSNGALSGAIFANTATAAATMLAGTVVPLVFHRPRGPHGSIAHGLAVVVSAVNPQSKFAVLRSRRD